MIGANGFVGGALARRLAKDGHELRVVLGPHRPASAELSAHGAGVHQADLADPNSLAEAAAGCDVVYHCAGESSGHAPREALAWINVAGTENVLRAARHARVPRLVVLSCADVSLVNRDRLHWKETAVLGQRPLGALAQSRLLAEELALAASDAKLMVTALRPAMVWGPGDHTHLPVLCAEARQGGVRLFGAGGNLFSTTYIDNLVDALVAAGRAGNLGGQAFHVADADILNAREFFTKLCAAVGLPPPRAGLYALAYAAAGVQHALGREGPWPDDVARRGRACLLDCLRAVTALDYRPAVSVEQGMQALAAWAAAAGGPAAIERLARTPTSGEDIARHRRLADEG